MKAKGKIGKRMYLKEVSKKNPTRFIRHFRSFKNVQKYGLTRKVVRNSKNKLKLRGSGVNFKGIREVIDPSTDSRFDPRYKPKGDKSVKIPKTSKQLDGFITQNDNEWIRKISNPYDKKIANDSLKTLRGLKNLMKNVDPDSTNKDMVELLGSLVKFKNDFVQIALGNRTDLNKRLQQNFKDIGLKLVGYSFLWDTGSDKFESVVEKKQAISAAYDDLINQARSKVQTALNNLQTVYMKQGDREENQRIRDEDEAKQKKLRDLDDAKREQERLQDQKDREKDRLENAPLSQVVENVNALGYGSSRSNVKVNPNDVEQVRKVRQNPFIRVQDKRYLDNLNQNNSASNRNKQIGNTQLGGW